MYSLVNVATLVRDLARHERGAQVATELLRAFALDDAAVESLEGTSYDATAALEPPPEPPGVRVRSHGLCVGP